MELAQPVLVIAAVAAGLFAGLILAMLSVVQSALNQLDYTAYTKVMQAIIVAGRRSIVVKLLLLVPIACAALCLYLQHEQTAARVSEGWLMSGLAFYVAGPLLVSRYLNEPWYDKIMRWSAHGDAVPGWQQQRSVWFRLNLVRFSTGALAFTSFVVALL